MSDFTVMSDEDIIDMQNRNEALMQELEASRKNARQLRNALQCSLDTIEDITGRYHFLKNMQSQQVGIEQVDSEGGHSKILVYGYV